MVIFSLSSGSLLFDEGLWSDGGESIIELLCSTEGSEESPISTDRARGSSLIRSAVFFGGSFSQNGDRLIGKVGRWGRR